MSVYKVVDTEMSDMEMLKTAISDLGIEESVLEHHQDGIRLRGFNNDRQASWVIRREKLDGARYDIGFEVKNGKIEAIIEDMDRSKLAGWIRSGKLRQCYAKRMTLRAIEKEFKKAKVQQRTLEDGRIRISVKLGS